MEHLALGLVWLLGTLASVSTMDNQLSMVEKTLDMAPNSFDDQYKDCSNHMEAKLKELNRTEFETNTMYALAWKGATIALQGVIPQLKVLKPEQAIALVASTFETPPVVEKFNEDVHEAGRSREEYLHNFHFKALHFLVTEAIRVLRDSQPPNCYQVYGGVKNIIYTAQPGQIVRFGHFTTYNLNKESAEEFGDGTFFSVKTCYGTPIRDIFDENSVDTVMVPPFETFKVMSVTRKGNTARIELRAQDVHSNYNCEFLKGQSVSQDTLWVFILAATALAI